MTGTDPVSSRPRFFATFRLPDGRDIELELNHEPFAAVAQGQQGKLTDQGTRYLGFEKSP